MAPLLQTTRWHGMRMGICKRARWPHQPGPTPTPAVPPATCRRHAHPGGPHPAMCRRHVSLAPRPPRWPPTPSHVQEPRQPGPTPTLVAPTATCRPHAHPSGPLPPATCRHHVSLTPHPPWWPPSHMQAPCQPGPTPTHMQALSRHESPLGL